MPKLRGLLFGACCLLFATSAHSATVRFSPGVTASQLQNAIADPRYDVIELTGGTYRLGTVRANANRSTNVTIRPAPGATVVFTSGSSAAFVFGRGGVASNIAIQDITFDSYRFDLTGIIWLGNAHDITLNRITVQNSTGATPYKSWALYLSADNGVGPSRVTATNWTVIGGSYRRMSGVKVGTSGGRSDITLRGWTIRNVAAAGYFVDGPTRNLVVDNWTVDNSGGTVYNPDLSVYFSGQSTGVYSNVRINATDSLRLYDYASGMVSGGGNAYAPF